MERQEKKWTSVKCPVLNFYGTKNLSVFIFYFQLQSLFPFFSGVLVNGHLYVNMKNQDQVLIDGLLENHVGRLFEMRTWEILPWLSFNLLISGLSTSLCMVSGRCCISLKTKSWREDSYYVKKYIFIGLISHEWILSRWSSNSIHPLRLWSWLIWHGPGFAGLLDTDHYQELKVCKDCAACNTTRTSRFGGWIDSRFTTRNIKCGEQV